jgi:hypothetical protein
MNNPAEQFVPDIEEYRLVRGQIEFEDNLITQRLSWFVAAQSFLFTAYAITMNAGPKGASQEFQYQQVLLFHLIPVVAIGSCVLIYATIVGGFLAQRNLRAYLAKKIPTERLAPFPMVQGALLTRMLGKAAPLGLPLVFVGVWLYLFVQGIAK